MGSSSKPSASSPMPPKVSEPGSKCPETSAPRRNLFPEDAADAAAPDHVSATASETSSEATSRSQPPQLLDFIGGACRGFASCFPCAVVDINDSDDYVVDKLSREKAMNVMYAKRRDEAAVADDPTVALAPAPDGDGGPVADETNGPVVVSPVPVSDSSLVSAEQQSKGSEEQDENTNVPPPDTEPEQTTHSDATIHSVPSAVVAEGDDDSGIVYHQEQAPSLESLDPAEASVEILPIPTQKSPPPKRRKTKFGMKLFGRKKKA